MGKPPFYFHITGKKMETDSDFFGIDYGKSKSKRLIFCQSDWQLYISLTLIGHTCGERVPTREEIKAVIKSIPGLPHPTCKCKDCRYHRLVKKFDK